MSVKIFLSALIISGVAAFGAAWANYAPPVPEDSPRRTPIVRAVEKSRLSVVNISTEKIVTLQYRSPFGGGEGDPFDQMLREFFGEQQQDPPRKVQGPLGSGIVFDAAGYVVTNEHVVRRASNIKLSLPDGASYDAVLLAADLTHDIALLKVQNPHGLTPVKLGNSGNVMLGETVIALGNPFGFESSVTTGIVSALHRSLTVGQDRKYADLIQTSALINPGNSGGPLLNIQGELIGMNTAVVGGAQGIGFAIPVDEIKDVVANLLSSPRVTSLWFGASLDESPPQPGAKVARVETGSPAAQAGLKTGDLIVSADRLTVAEPLDLARYILGLEPNHRLSLTYLRDGAKKQTLVTLAVRPKPTPSKLISERLGLSCQDVNASLASRLGLYVNQGVLVDEATPDGPAARAGLAQGDVITQVGPHRVSTCGQLADLLQSANPGDVLSIQLVRQQYVAYTRVEAR